MYNRCVKNWLKILNRFWKNEKNVRFPRGGGGVDSHCTQRHTTLPCDVGINYNPCVAIRVIYHERADALQALLPTQAPGGPAKCLFTGPGWVYCVRYRRTTVAIYRRNTSTQQLRNLDCKCRINSKLLAKLAAMWPKWHVCVILSPLPDNEGDYVFGLPACLHVLYFDSIKIVLLLDMIKFCLFRDNVIPDVRTADVARTSCRRRSRRPHPTSSRRRAYYVEFFEGIFLQNI